MEQRLKRRFQAVSLQPAAAVKMVIHRYKTYAEERKYPGYVIPHFQVITPETGKVFYQDALDIPASGLFQHFPDSRAFKIFSAPAIVTKFKDVCAFQFRRPAYER